MATISILVGCAAWWAVNHVIKGPCHTTALKGEQWVDELLTGSHRRFRNQLRMLPSTFNSLLATLQSKYSLSSSRYVSAKEKLATFLFVIASLLLLYPVVVTLPSKDIPYEIHSNPKMYPFFEHCVGALDGTHIRATPPPGFAKPFRNRKGYVSQNVVAACSFDLRFVYVLAGWEGAASDGRVLSDALLGKGFEIPEGKMYLGDAGYSLKTNLLTPYRGVRYHLREWAAGNQRPQNARELYNLRHYQQRNCIERVFGVLKKRFKILEYPSEYPFTTQVDLVYTLCALHNIVMELEYDRHFLQMADKAKKKRDQLQKRRANRHRRMSNVPTE
ncbi:hypothetical protein H310_07185 [Aphanomyces invadans]|uniref:Uncharacterized protein n=1 Tax=Aphanomyces invadans TaxID=157072 RepID=A0A024U2Y5_9STRA|nr:hypothetical protein H310_07185 [Aphanomyces invadans]ETW00614.1 hypothetical protein H310_07185 [Aphanomyces invadans]|eukprot:XP_008870749.1 hypothetical protein H310_07185 [Aphanomyces invadans]